MVLLSWFGTCCQGQNLGKLQTTHPAGGGESSEPAPEDDDSDRVAADRDALVRVLSANIASVLAAEAGGGTPRSTATASERASATAPGAEDRFEAAVGSSHQRTLSDQTDASMAFSEVSVNAPRFPTEFADGMTVGRVAGLGLWTGD